MQLFSEDIRNFWNGWEIRLLVLLSLALQTVLTIFGSRRKYTAAILLRILVWLAYLSADWVATFVLGNLATITDGDCEEKSPKSNEDLQAFWAPFLLLHLGGPDTITAYSLEDNELWLRHFLAFIVQVGVAFYVFLRLWRNTVLAFMAIPILFIASYKYGERTFVLRSSSKENFKDSLVLSDPKPGPEFVKMAGETIVEGSNCEQGSHLIQAYFLFGRLAVLFSSQILTCKDEIMSCKYFQGKSAEVAFNLVAAELGFLYDLLYTKANVVYSRLGILVRCFSLFVSFSLLFAFPFTIDKHAYPPVDIFITYLLLLGAIALELYAFILHFFSKWTSLCLTKYRKEDHPHIFYATSLSHSLLGNHKRWSESMGQFNLISFCINDKLLPATRISKLLEYHRYLTREDVSADLKKLIFTELMAKIKNHEQHQPFCLNATGQRLLDHRGDYVLKEKHNTHNPDILWLTASAPYDCCLLAWHIATDLCYQADLDELCDGNPESLHPRCKISKYLSEYLMYLMVLCPTMMPEGFSDTRFVQTCKDVKTFYAKNIAGDSEEKRRDARKIFLQRRLEGSTIKDIVNNNLSAFVPGRWLGNQLQLLEAREGWGSEGKWKMISEVWVEILAYTASHCAWNVHGQYLRRGGELLTHVCLLMSHLGLCSQYGDFRFRPPEDDVVTYII